MTKFLKPEDFKNNPELMKRLESIKSEEIKKKEIKINYIPNPEKISLFKPENLMKETKIVLAILYDKNIKKIAKFKNNLIY